MTLINPYITRSQLFLILCHFIKDTFQIENLTMIKILMQQLQIYYWSPYQPTCTSTNYTGYLSPKDQDKWKEVKSPNFFCLCWNLNMRHRSQFSIQYHQITPLVCCLYIYICFWSCPEMIVQQSLIIHTTTSPNTINIHDNNR